MKKLVLLLIGFTALTVSAQTYEWTKSIGGTGDDRANIIKVDASGNVFVAGAFSGTVDFDPGAGTTNLTSAGGFDLYVAKYDATGNFLWAASDGNIYDDFVLDMDVDPSGNVYITGYGGLNVTGSVRAMIVGKLDANGSTQWAQTYANADPAGTVGGYALSVDASGNVFVGGNFSDSVDFDPGPGTYYIKAVSGSNNPYILKLNTIGDFQWVKKFACNGNANVDYLAIDGSGNIYSTGNFWDQNMNCDPAQGNGYVTNHGSADIFISKLDVNGDYVWAKGMGSIGLDYGFSIALDASGNVYTSGFFEGTVDFDPGSGTQSLTSAGDRDCFISKLDASGNYVWAKSMGSSGKDYANSIALDASGNIYTTGFFESTVDFDPGTGTQNLASAGDKDMFVQKLDNNGNLVWVKSIGASGEDSGNSIFLDASNNIYLTGNFNSTVDFDFTTGTSNLTSAGSRDAYFTKWSQSSVGVGENIISENVKIYPNPTTSQLTITNLQSTKYRVTIIDLTGKVVKSLVPSSNTIDVSTLTNGVYILQIHTEKGIMRKKFIKA